MSSPPVAIHRSERSPSAAEIESAVATVRAALDPRLLVTLAFYLDALRRERAHGGLDVRLNMRDGRVEAADFSRRSHWRGVRGDAAP